MGSSDSNFIISWYAISSTIWMMMMIIIINLLICSSFSLPIINNITHINYSNNNNNNNNHTELDDYLYNYSSTSLAKKPADHTGVLYNISLPANFSGMKVSVLRLRSSTLWAKGANLSCFDIPPKAITMPHVRRLAFMYENLGKFSSQYYELPGYTFTTNVIGFAVYNASDTSAGTRSNQRLNITLHGEPIKVDFSQNEVLLSSQMKNNTTTVDNKLKKCVRFDPLNGVVELANMLRPNVCLSKGVGHFVIAVPNSNDTIKKPPSPSPSMALSPSSLGRRSEPKGNRIAVWVWWVVGFAGGFLGLMLLALCFVIGYRTFVSRKITRLETNSLESESLHTLWIGNSKLPLAPVSRTQAVLENDLAP